MSIAEGYKRIYADDLAAGLGFEWDYENASDDDLYEALEVMGYTWDSERRSWLSPEYQEQLDQARIRASKPKRTRRIRRAANVKEQLRAWNEGKPIR